MKAARLVPMLLGSILALGTTVVPASVERLTAESTQVVLARAIDSRSAWDAAHRRIYTYTRFQSLRMMKGSLPVTFTVKALGGSADGYTMKVAGVRGWQRGENAVLFLQADSDGTFFVTGLMQGNFRVSRQASGEPVASNGVSGVKQLDASGNIIGYRGAHMSLSELEQRVRKAAQ